MAVATRIEGDGSARLNPLGLCLPFRPARRGCRRYSSSWRAGLLACGLAVAAWTGDAVAIGLGAATVTSSLGEPLRLSLPVTVAPDEEVGCIQVRPGGGDLPAVFNTRSQVIRSGGATRIEIRSAQAVNEPAVGLVVSVGCSAPISRDYVLFLDPPIVSATAEGAPAATPLRRVNPMPVPVRRAPSARPPTAVSGADGAAPPRPRPRAAPRAPRPKVRPIAPAPLTVPDVTGTVRPPAATPVPAPAATPRAPGSDRLSVVPTEPTPPTSSGAPVAAGPVAPITAVASPAAAPAATTPAVDAGATAAPAPAVDPAAVAREEVLRQQQAALLAQVKSLGDQIAALRAQATTLAQRNDALERTAVSPWWLIALAIVALLIAAWMAWRYLQLRRSIDGAAWWTNNTMQADGMTVQSAGDDQNDLDPGTRMAPRSFVRTDVRQTAPVSGLTTSNSTVERPKPAARSNYPAAMDTDFTVSDIEAAMATVRTVSPPRPTKPAAGLEDSDFAPLGGPTLPSPFAEPPPGAPALSGTQKSAPQAPSPAEAAHFVDFDIPPMTVGNGAAKAPRPATSGKTPAPPASAPHGDHAGGEHFDPLASDSLKTTVIDGSGNASSAFGASAPTELDFELPSATQVMAITQLMDIPTGGGRHADSLLDDLFQASDARGVDTILDLDERHGEPLSITEIDRLTTTDTATPGADPRPKTRMARFASLMNRVDEAAATEPLRAIAQLRQFVLRDENIPTILWLRLFELYREVDKRAVYDALADHFARRYGRPMVAWGQTFADRVPQTPLSANPQIDRQIESMWGSDAGLAKLEALLCGHDQDDAIVFNAVLQRDLLDAAKIFPSGAQPQGNDTASKTDPA